MAADLFATPEQVTNRTQGAITPETHPGLADELAAATADFRAFCRWHVAPRKPLEYRRVGPSSDDVWLPAMQIASIDEVRIDGRDIDPETVEFDPSTGWTSLYGRNVYVKFTAGYAEIPANISAAAMELAAQALGTALGFVREQAGGVSVQYSRAGGGIDEDTPGGARLVAYRLGRIP